MQNCCVAIAVKGGVWLTRTPPLACSSKPHYRWLSTGFARNLSFRTERLLVGAANRPVPAHLPANRNR
ncbi:MAG: hypothetical protein CMJ70_19520 [Planctomycetaceae bacterium]|nr:hypothetical protein [Planctomycetaceae bacterium]